MYLGIRSTFSIFPHTTVHWKNNHATLRGAIYVSDVNFLIYCILIASFIPGENCFFQLSDRKLSGGLDVQFVFKNNSADDAGSVLYGGTIDNCKFTDLDSYRSGKVFNMLVHIEDNTDFNASSNISSDPLQICPCKNNIPDCSRSQYYNAPNLVHPGEMFHFSVVAVGQRDATVPSTVRITARTNAIEFQPVDLLDPGQQFWVGYDDSSHELILHPHCPLDYCVNDAKIFPLNNTDLQCAYNRSGLLCGRCEKGYSLVLGTHQCMTCTNSHLALLIPFALMGVALVFLLLVFKLTIATGTLSGLVFYANIVGVNHTIFLPVKSTDALSVFIAWLNLDFGIETRFYNGMDAYSKTWLQLVFPVYIWVLVGLVIFVSYFSQRFANLLGNNPVSVLATLILFYAKILRTLITAVYITHLEYPTELCGCMTETLTISLTNTFHSS